MTQENHDINRQLLDHLESGTWDPYHQQHISASDKARLVFDIQQRVRRTNMQHLTSRPFRAMVWVLVLFMFVAAGWAFVNQSRPAVVDNLVNPNLAQPGQAGEESTPTSELLPVEPEVAARAIRFGGDIYLDNYTIFIGKLSGQTQFAFHLVWDSTHDVTGQLNLFVHLLSQDGTLVAQYDNPIFVSDSTESQHTWAEDQPVEQFFQFTVGEEAAAAEPYQVFFGLYETESGNRLPVSYFEQLQVNDQLFLTEVRLNNDEALTISPKGGGVMVVDMVASNDVKATINVHEAQLLLLSNAQGTAIIALEFTGRDDIVTYRWRYRPAVGGLESAGNGILQEVYAQTPTPNGFHLVDMGSQLFINIADMSVEWSYNNEDAGWIYYNPQLLDAQAINGDFDTFDLSTVTP